VKTIIAVLLSLSGGAAVGAAAVSTVSAVVDTDSGTVEQSENQVLDEIMVYGARG
jgi:hypothetical protein